MMRIWLAAALLTACVSAPVGAHAPPRDLRALIAEARSEARTGDSVWAGFSASPAGVLLVEAERETLFCHDGPASEFWAAGRDGVTGCAMRQRARVFPPNLLASFPAIDGQPTIVIGTPEATGQSHDAWLITLLHERFHQMQDASPGHAAAVAALDLAGGDQTGMWMLNYPFPYQQGETAAAFAVLARAGVAVLDAQGAERGAALRAYIEAREAARASVSAADWRYFEFQSWKEGVARWTQIAIGRRARSPAIRALAETQHGEIRTRLAALDLAAAGRVAFYAIGAAEAEMLERAGPDWRGAYFDHLALGPLLQRAARQG